jgi:phospholipid/cholesterol/gamma-HCH transport system substrate-binding protein
METRAPYPLIGLFVLAVIAAVFGFVYWLHNTGGLGARIVYQVRFENTVSGLLTGSAVLFNGIRVGEVTALTLDPQDPRRITATIAVAADTPVRPDTQVGLEFQGLTGVPVITLQGGSAPSDQWPVRTGNVPVLTADPDAGRSMTTAARDALRKVDKVLSDNAEPLRNTIANLKTFTDALARNSDRIDTIITGVEKFTGVAEPGASPTYDLTAATGFPSLPGQANRTVVISDPTIPIAFDVRKIAVQGAPRLDKSFAVAQWADNVPRLVQTRILQSFENAGFLNSVGRPLDELAPDYRLSLDIREFQVSAAPQPTAKVAITAKIVSDADRTIIAARIFNATSPVQTLDAGGAAAGIDQAFGRVATEIVNWAAGAIPADTADPPSPADTGTPPAPPP